MTDRQKIKEAATKLEILIDIDKFDKEIRSDNYRELSDLGLRVYCCLMASIKDF